MNRFDFITAQSFSHQFSRGQGEFHTQKIKALILDVDNFYFYKTLHSISFLELETR